MEKTVNATLHNLVDLATEKLFSNSTVEHAKDSFYDAKDKFYDVKDKYASKFSKKSDSNNALLYTGLAVLAVGAAYLIYKNRDVIKAKVLDFADQLEAMKNNLENEQQNAPNA